jgi:hypothetical protein
MCSRSVFSYDWEHSVLDLRVRDIRPDYGKRIILTMQEMEQKVFLNVTTFDKKLEEINQTVKSLVAKSANDCLTLVLDAVGNKMSGLESRMIGLNKKHVEIDRELSHTLKKLDDFSTTVETILDEANEKALSTLHLRLQDIVTTLMKGKLLAHSEEDPSRLHFRAKSHSAVQEYGHSCSASASTDSHVPRGRSRERFSLRQSHLILRARSVSSECELRDLISDARSVAALDRVDDDN